MALLRIWPGHILVATNRVGSGDDHIRVAGHDLAGEGGITLVMPLGGVAFDDQIFSFDLTQAP
jgi:hypothetical protein